MKSFRFELQGGWYTEVHYPWDKRFIKCNNEMLKSSCYLSHNTLPESPTFRYWQAPYWDTSSKSQLTDFLGLGSLIWGGELTSKRVWLYILLTTISLSWLGNLPILRKYKKKPHFCHMGSDSSLSLPCSLCLVLGPELTPEPSPCYCLPVCPWQ